MKKLNLCKSGHQPRRIFYVWERINRIFRVCSVCGLDIWEVLDSARESQVNLLLDIINDPYQRNGEGGFRDGIEVVMVLVLLVLFLCMVKAWQAALEGWFTCAGG